MAGCRADFITTHRLATIKVAHRIAVLSAGSIIELGTHAELMEKNGLYARLYSMQFRNPEEELTGLLARSQPALAETPDLPKKREGFLNSMR